MLESNHIEPVEEDYTQINISTEEMEEIEAMGRDPDIYQKLVKSLAPSIYGHERIKEALVLQMLGGVKKMRTDGVAVRGDGNVAFRSSAGDQRDPCELHYLE